MRPRGLTLLGAIALFLIHEFYPDNQELNLAGIMRMDRALDTARYVGLSHGSGLCIEA